MASLLKHRYNKKLITRVGNEICKQYPAFDQTAFNNHVFNKDWANKELKQRMRHISECLHRHLPANYKKAIKILKPVAARFTGFEYMFFQDYVECFGLNDFATSVNALEHFTKYASAEFAVRAFILQDEKRMMRQMRQWAKSDDHHVRRLSSEGCRPRLPWAIALPGFKNNPQPVLAILKILMQDESEYVRRSVANNLNDISRDNPDIVLDWAQYWLADNPARNTHTERLIKHACRTLLKQGEQNALSLFGWSEAKHIKVSQFTVQKQVTLGENLPFSFLLKSSQARLGKCRIEFAIEFIKANGNSTRKIFKIAEADYAQKDKQLTKYFSFKKISTRKYYAGRHKLAIIVNGVEQVSKPFNLCL